MHVTFRMGKPTTVADIAAVLRVEYCIRLAAPEDVPGGVPRYTMQLAEALAIVESIVATALVDARPPLGARLTVTAQARAYPTTEATTVLDLTLRRQRLTPTGALQLVWVRAGGGGL